MTGENTYKERNSGINQAEVIFEEYCKSKNYFLERLGFDEKRNPIPRFFNLNPSIRNLPDYYWSHGDKSALIMVKGTANIKQSEIELIPKFLEWYDSEKCPLVYVFCFADKPIIKKFPEEILDLYSKSYDREWPDGVVYRNINLN